MNSPRRPLCILLALTAVSLGGCGADDVRDEVARARADVEQRVADASKTFKERRERYGRRFREVLDELQQVVPRAERTNPAVRSRGDNEPETIDEFLTRVLTNIDRYWTRTFAAADLPEPRVGFATIAPGGARPTACGTLARDDAAFYCPGDDTIYVAQRFAADLYRGVLRGLPGERAGYGRAAGLAGTWAHSVFEQGLLQPGDIEEATNAALAVGDFDVGNAQHHGTPIQRRAALLTGYETGEPAQCDRFVSPA